MDGPGIAGSLSAQPLADIRVLEMGVGVAGPVLARNLANFGADVIRVESARRPDSLRVGGAGWIPSEVDNAIRRDTRPLLDFSSAGKRSLGLEIDNAAGREVFERLVAVSDVYVTNLSANVLPKLGVTYEDLCRHRPDIVYISLTSFGDGDGPYSTYRSWGHNLTATAGLDARIGWPDRAPVQLGMAYPDYVAAHSGTAAVVAALLRRDLTGQGCCIGVSQFELAAACQVLGLAEVQMGTTDVGAIGNRRRGACPHGVYRCRGEERWVAISVLSDEMWHGLCHSEGLEHLGDDPRFSTPALRAEHEDELDDALAAWTCARTDWDVATELQHHGVAAAPVMDSWDILGDVHLHSRDAIRVVPSPRFGHDLFYGQAMALQETPPRIWRTAPAMGEHSREVLVDLLGYSEEAVDELVSVGVVTEMVEPTFVLERPYRNWIDKLVRLPWPPADFDPYEVIGAQLRSRALTAREEESRRP